MSPGRRSHLFVGIPIEIARRRMTTIIGIIASEAKAPTKNVILNAVASGIANISPACRGSCITTVNILRNTPAITGPIAPPIILIVLNVADTTPVASLGVKYMMTLADKDRNVPPTAVIISQSVS